MDAAVKTEWLKRLRSGEYTQYQGRLGLKHTTERCCLGVLTDILVENGRLDSSYDHEHPNNVAVQDIPQPGFFAHPNSGNLPYSAAIAIGMPTYSPGNPAIPLTALSEEQRQRVKWDDARQTNPTLAELNDGGLTFEEIADLIERFL